MLWYKSISAWIESEGRELAQYKFTEEWPKSPASRDEDYPTISCWIPSELGQTFEICFTDDDLQGSICGYVQIDGTRCGSKFLRAPIDNGKVMRKDGVRTSETEMCYFQFADAVTTDDDHYRGQAPEGMGEIRITMRDVHISQPYYEQARRRPRSSFPTFDRRVVHEKDKKGLMHSVRFATNNRGGGVQRSKPPLRVVPYGPIVEFVFRYAPLDKLRADGIAPPLHAPPVKAEPTTEEDQKIEFIDLTLDDDEPSPEPKEMVFIDLTIDDLDVPVIPKNESESEVILILDDEQESEPPVLQIFQ